MSFKVQCPACGKVAQFSASDVGMVTLCTACGTRYWVTPESESGPGTPPTTEAAPRPVPVPVPPPATPAPLSDSHITPDVLADLAVPAGEREWGLTPSGDPAPAAPGDEHDANTAAAEALARALGGGTPVTPAPPDASARRTPIPSPATATPPQSVYTPRPPIATLPPGQAAPPIPAAPAAPIDPRQRTRAIVLLACGAVGLIFLLGLVIVLSARPSWEDRNATAIRELKARAEALAADHKYQDAYDTYARLDDLVGTHAIRDGGLRGEVEHARLERDYLARTLADKTQSQYATVTLPETPQPVTTSPAPQGATVTTTRTTTGPSAADRIAAATLPARRALPATLPAAPNWLPRPPVRVTPPEEVAGPPAELNDEMIGQSIQRGVDYLIGHFSNGLLRGQPGAGNNALQTGADALCVYALVQAGMATGDRRLDPKGPLVRQLLDNLRGMPAENANTTYARAIRATALALVNRPEDRPTLLQDANYLLRSHFGGAYTYQRPLNLDPKQEAMSAGWDNSNSQYGLLGVWSAAEVGAEVNSSYWQAVESHWTRTQLANGSWDYAPGGKPDSPGRISMAFAGVASLFVTHDYLDAPRVASQVGRPPFSKALARGLEYIEAGDTAVNFDWGGGYTLYGLERVGLASGFKYFGDHDWYRVHAARIIRRQGADGAWSFSGVGNITWDADIETAFNLLFLARGRHPVLMNKLRYDGPWANRPRDVANLARFASHEIERPLNWQVVPLSRDWTDWMDSPILSITTHRPVDFTDEDLAKFRSYVQAGGMLFTQADGDSPDADRWARFLAARLFPAYPMRPLPEDHELYGVLFKPADRPPLQYVTNGSRILMLHSPADITQHWQMRAERTRRGLFQLGVNLFLYATGKGDPRNRLASPVLPEPQFPANGGRVAVARVKYAGNWDPEPMAWQRFARYFQRETDVALDVSPTELARLDPHAAGFAHWTGTARYAPTDAEIAAIRKFVNGGGVLLVEPCGGGGEFYESAKAALRKAFPESQLQMVPKTHPMLTVSGPSMDDLSKPRTRTYVKAKGQNTTGRIDALTAGRGKVILSPLDLTTGLLGCNTWGVLGFDPDYSLKLAKNIVLWSATGMPEGRSKD